MLTCLNEAQRRTALRLLGLDDPFVADPQARRRRRPSARRGCALVRRFEAMLARRAGRALDPAAARGRRAGRAVRTLDQLFDDPQARANGLVQEVATPGAPTPCGCSAACSRSTARRPARGAACPRSASTPPRCSPSSRRRRAGDVAFEAAAFAEAVATAADRTLAGAGAVAARRGAGRPLPGALRRARGDGLAGARPRRRRWRRSPRRPRSQLGRRLAPLAELDALLGGSPLAGELVRYGAARAVDAGGARPRSCAPSRSRTATRSASTACSSGGRTAGSATSRSRAWTAASTGYLAGLSEWALATALEHVKGRRAFGATLAALGPVQQRLADAADRARGLALLADDPPGRAALAHAGAAAVEVTAACQQVVGAIGFTLEFPLQRALPARARHAAVGRRALLG